MENDQLRTEETSDDSKTTPTVHRSFFTRTSAKPRIDPNPPDLPVRCPPPRPMPSASAFAAFTLRCRRLTPAGRLNAHSLLSPRNASAEPDPDELLCVALDGTLHSVAGDGVHRSQNVIREAPNCSVQPPSSFEVVAASIVHVPGLILLIR